MDMGARYTLLFLAAALECLRAQTVCPAMAVYSPCDIVFELNDAEAAAHPNPSVSVDVNAEFRSSSHRTYLMPAFWDGGRRMVIRFSPTEPGDWDYRVSSNIQRFEGLTGKFTGAPVDNPALGFIRAANLRHFAYTDANKNVPHLWMGGPSPQPKVNHIRMPVPGALQDPKFDDSLRALNRSGVIADLILSTGRGQLTKLYPAWQDRERFIRNVVAHYAAFNVTWQIVDAFEEYESGRELMKEVGLLLKKLDPYQHPRSTGALTTSAPLLEDGWMDYITYRSADDQLGAIEHQLYGAPAINIGVGDAPDADTERHRLWNAAMNGQYPEFGNASWYDFFSETRHWDLEPYFDVDGGRALALEDVEYIVYVEKPGQIEVAVEKHGYDVAWFNPVNGEWVKQKKEFKGEKFLGEPPDRKHDWVLRLSRESKKESMRKSFRFEARTPVLQEVEQTSEKTPFEIVEPKIDTLSLSKPAPYATRLKRETRATRSVMYLWTGEVAADGQGYRVLGTAAKGTLQIPPGIARHFPAVLQLRIAAMNANGKVYMADKIVQLTQ
jgi:hypothetical protein